MLKDRGTIKWTSLMLPEHVQMLKELWAEDDCHARPLLDNQLLDELNRHMNHAIQEHKKVRLIIHLNGRQQILIGKLRQQQLDRQSVVLQLPDGDEQRINIDTIIDLQLDS